VLPIFRKRPWNVMAMVLERLCYKSRFTCALVCKAWAEAATAATRSIILKHRVQDLTCLQHWLEKHGKQLEVLQLHECYPVALSALPCAQLQDLLLHGALEDDGHNTTTTTRVDSTVWSDIAAATKLTSVSLSRLNTASQQADVVSALRALPDLQQLSWSWTSCGSEQHLSDSLLLQQLTQLTGLNLVAVSAKALQHLGLLTKLQHLSITNARDWAAAGCPGLQELKALSSFHLLLSHTEDIPASITELTALQQLHVEEATPTALNTLQALTGLTQLRVEALKGLSAQSAPLQLPGLQHLGLCGRFRPAPMSFLTGCTHLLVLELSELDLRGPGSLVGSTKLQHLELNRGSISAADGAAGPVPWQQVFAGPNQLPYLTSLYMDNMRPRLQQADMECVVACCSSLQVLHLFTMYEGSTALSALVRLPGLTSLHLWGIDDEMCSSLAQLTGLRELTTKDSMLLSTAGFRQLAILEQLTSLAFEYGLNANTVSREVQALMSDKLQDYEDAMINKV